MPSTTSRGLLYMLQPTKVYDITIVCLFHCFLLTMFIAPVVLFTTVGEMITLCPWADMVTQGAPAEEEAEAEEAEAEEHSGFLSVNEWMVT